MRASIHVEMTCLRVDSLRFVDSIVSYVTLSLLTVPSPILTKFPKLQTSKELLNSFPVNGHILGFCP